MQTLIADEKIQFKFAEAQSRHSLSLYSFAGRSVVIFGDSNGLGTSLIKELVHQKALLTLVVRTRGEQERAHRELQTVTDQSVSILVCDTTDKMQMRSVIREINQMVGFIDVMVNNLPKQSALNAFCEVLPIFYRQREGRIININLDFSTDLAGMDLHRYNINMTTVHLSAFVSLDVAAFEILKAVRKFKTDIVISESSVHGKAHAKISSEFSNAPARTWIH